MRAFLRLMQGIASWIGLTIIMVIASVTIYIAFMAWWEPPRHNSTNVEMFKEGQWIYQEDSKLGTSLIPGSHGRSSANGVIYDSYHGPFGNRVGAPNEQSRHDAELIYMGCSQAWGQGVAYGDLASTITAKKLGVHSLNLAVPGTGSVYAAKRLEDLPALSPKYIVYLFYEDHIYRNVRRCAPVDNPLCIQLITAARDPSGQYQYRYPTYFVEKIGGGVFALMRRWYLDQYGGSGRLSYWKDAYWVLMDIYGKAYKALLDNPTVTNPGYRGEVIAAFDFALGRIAQYAKDRDAEVIVVYIPNYSYPSHLKPLPEDLRQVLTKYGTRIVDMAEPFNKTIGLEPGDRGIYLFAIPNDGHLSPLGHAMIAEKIVSALNREPFD